MRMILHEQQVVCLAKQHLLAQLGSASISFLKVFSTAAIDFQKSRSGIKKDYDNRWDDNRSCDRSISGFRSLA